MRVTNVDADGVDIENSPFCHLFVLGIVSQLATWFSLHEPAVAPDWERTKRGMVHYLAYVTQPNGRLPMLGATSTTIVPNQEPLVFGTLATLDPEFEWVWSRGTRGVAPAKRAELFPVSGLFVLRAPDASLQQTFMTFDSGIYRTDHSHLDALAVTLYSDGAELFPDSGLHTYDPGAAYDYFHGTRGHNTVVVDGQDQTPGAAIPGAYGVSGVTSWATGESTLYAGVTHRRTVVVVEQGVVLVTDDLTSATPHDYDQTWHAFSGAGLALDGLDATVDNVLGAPLVLVRQANPSGLSVRHAYGATAPMQGWVSSAFGKKDPSHSLEYRRHGNNASFATLFAIGRRARSTTPAYVEDSRDVGTGDRIVRIFADGVRKTVRIAHEGTASATVSVTATN